MPRDFFPHHVVRLSSFIQCALVVLFVCGAVANSNSQIPVAGRDWIEAVPAAFSPRSNMDVLNHANKLWVIGGLDGQIRSDVWSGDGTSWTRATASAFAAREGFASTTFNGRMWVFGGSCPTHPISNTEVTVRYLPDAWSSADGVTWSAEPIATSFLRAGHSVTEFNGKLWLIGGEYRIEISFLNQDIFYRDVWSSADGTHWTSTNQAAPFLGRRDHVAVVFNNRLWVIGGRNKANYFSSDALNDVWSSADGVNWTTATLQAEFSPRYDHACFVLGDKLWLVGGSDGSGVKNNEIWNTSDGAHWTRVTPDPAFLPRAGHACAVVGSEAWIIGGAYDGSLHSADGVHWTQVPLAHPGSRSGQATISHNGKLWVIAGSMNNQLRNDVWSSPDARHWTRVAEHAAFSPVSNMVGLSYGGNMWLMGGGGGRVWRSSNGADWTTMTTTAAFYDIQGGLVHDSKMWVFSGTTCWSSTDGLAWTNAAGTFTVRNNMGVAALNGKMYLMGGWRVGSNGKYWWTETISNVHSSADGDSWAQVVAGGPYCAYPGAAAFNRRLWVVGGQTFAYGMGGAYYPVYQSSVYASFDGAAWTAPASSVPFPPRSSPSMNVLGDRLYLSGGKNQDGFPSDFWYTVADDAGKNSADAAWLQYQ